MYKLSKRLKILSLALIIIGATGWFSSYTSSHHLTLEDVKTMLAEEDTHHGGDHSATHNKNSHSEMIQLHHNEHDASSHAKGEHHKSSHAEHVLHQMHNRPYAALYVAAFFFMMISLGVLAFYGIQYASQAGWSPVLFRVMEAITYYLLPGAIIVLGIAIWADKHLFIWMDPDVVSHDELIQGKSNWLNKKWFIIRGILFILGWSIYRFFSRKFSIAQDNSDINDNSYFKKNFNFCFIIIKISISGRSN